MLALTLLFGINSAKSTIPRFWPRLFFVGMLTAAGILTTATGPIVQSLFEDTLRWGNLSWGLRYFRALNFARAVDLLKYLLAWGVLPGAMSATAAVSTRGGWLRKVVSSSIVASLAFIVLDVAYHGKFSSNPMDIGYITNINVVGGVLAGMVIGSLGYLGERFCLHDLALSRLRNQFSKQALLVTFIAPILLLYLTWYFFLDHPPVSAWLRFGSWEVVDLSQYGDSLDEPDGYRLLGNEQWISFVLRPNRTASIGHGKSLQLTSANTSAESQHEVDPQKFYKTFRHRRPIPFEYAQSTFRIEGDGDTLHVVGKDEKLVIGIGLPTFDFVRVQRRDGGGCSATFFGRPFSESEARMGFWGEYSVYISSGSYDSETRPFKLVGAAGGLRKELYVEKNNHDFVQLDSDEGSLALKTLVSDLALADCDKAAEWPKTLDFFAGKSGEGLLRVGISNYNINSGDEVLLANGLLESKIKDGALVLQGTAKDIWINDIRINQSRWGRTSIELKSTIIASLIGAMGASIGWLLRKRQSD